MGLCARLVNAGQMKKPTKKFLIVSCILNKSLVSCVSLRCRKNTDKLLHLDSDLILVDLRENCKTHTSRLKEWLIHYQKFSGRVKMANGFDKHNPRYHKAFVEEAGSIHRILVLRQQLALGCNSDVSIHLFCKSFEACRRLSVSTALLQDTALHLQQASEVITS